MTMTQKISARILAHVAAGKDIREAMDLVLGAGTFEKLAGELHTELRARAAVAS